MLINPSYVHDDFKIRIGAYGIGGNMWITTVCSEKDNEYNLGMPSKRWSQVYAVNSAISTSDETMKRNITPLDGNTTKNFIMGLNPISYIRTDGESGRTHVQAYNDYHCMVPHNSRLHYQIQYGLLNH